MVEPLLSSIIIAKSLPFDLTDTCTAVIIPLVQKFCDEIPKQCSESLLTVAKLFGKLSYGLSGKDQYSTVFQIREGSGVKKPRKLAT